MYNFMTMYGKKNPFYRHGMSQTRFNNIYRGIKTRCENKNSNNYDLYGGRGIKCLWNSFNDFIIDMHNEYEKHVEEFGEKNTSIDRIDNNSDYCRNNCKWSTNKEQSNNRRSNRFLTLNSETMTMEEWGKKCPVSKQTIFKRLHRGWSVERALTEESRRNK